MVATIDMSEYVEKVRSLIASPDKWTQGAKYRLRETGEAIEDVYGVRGTRGEDRIELAAGTFIKISDIAMSINGAMQIADYIFVKRDRGIGDILNLEDYKVSQAARRQIGFLCWAQHDMNTATFNDEATHEQVIDLLTGTINHINHLAFMDGLDR